MRRSTTKILTSHGGNLPRPPEFQALLEDSKNHQPEIKAKLPDAVKWVIDKQIECGVDILNDGEYVKAADAGNYAGYIHARVTGWETKPIDTSKPRKRAGVAERDRKDFPGFYNSGLWLAGSGGPLRPGFFKPGAPKEPTTERVCTSAITYTAKGKDDIAKDIDAMKKGLAGKSGVDGFIACLGPLSLGAVARNEFYKDEKEYMFAVADAVREEYKAVTDAGLIVQVDEPEFATTWMFYPEWSVEEYRKYLDFAVEIINHAVRGLPQEQLRFHMCWGSGHRPHTHDIEFKHIVDKLIKINTQAYSFEASNVRHAHEYNVFDDVKLPEGKIIVPGVIGHYTDLVEHPLLISERLQNFAKRVGMENVHAGTDCGIGSRVGHEEIAWAKLKAMSEGAILASKAMKTK